MSAFSFLFRKEKEEYERKIKDFEKKLEDKDKEISNLITELEKTHEEVSNLVVELEKANNKVSPKQFTVIERNIKESQEKAAKYAKILSSFGLKTNKKYYHYRLEISKFYNGAKYEDVLEALTKIGVKFLDELTEVNLQSILNDVKNAEEAKKKFINYKNGKVDWEIATLINRGEKLSKVYSSRKLLNVFSELCLEYIDDIDDFDFNSLKIYNFTYPQIEEHKEKRDNYYKERRIIE